jgi:hypothetical protein
VLCAATSRRDAAPACRRRPPPTEAAPSLGVRAPDVPRVYPVHVSPSPSRRTRAPRTGRTAGPSRAHRTRANRGAAVPRRHRGQHHRVTGDSLFKVATPRARRAELPPLPRRPPWKSPPPSTSLASFYSHPITQAPPLGLLGPPSIACCPNRVLPSPESRPPRPSPPATAAVTSGHRRAPSSGVLPPKL